MDNRLTSFHFSVGAHSRHGERSDRGNDCGKKYDDAGQQETSLSNDPWHTNEENDTPYVKKGGEQHPFHPTKFDRLWLLFLIFDDYLSFFCIVMTDILGEK